MIISSETPELLANLFQDLPVALPEELFTTLCNHHSVKIERIVSYGHNSPANFWYDQDWMEWVLLLEGQACLEFESGRTLILNVGDYVSIPAHTRHRVNRTADNTATIWLAVHIF